MEDDSWIGYLLWEEDEEREEHERKVTEFQEDLERFLESVRILGEGLSGI